MEGFKGFKDKRRVAFSDFTKIEGDNGLGKTSIGEAISWGFLGSNLLGNTRSDSVLLNKSSKRMAVTILFSDGKRSHILIRERRGSVTSILLNSKTITQSELTMKIGSKDIFLSIFNPDYFSSLPDRSGRDILISVLPRIEETSVLEKMDDISIDYIRKDLHLLHDNPNLYMKDIRADIRELEKDLLFNEGVLSKIVINNDNIQPKLFDSSRLEVLEKELDKLKEVNRELNNEEINKLNVEKHKLEKQIITVKSKEFVKIDTLEKHKQLSEFEKEMLLIKADKFRISEEDTKKLYNLESQYQNLKDEYTKGEKLSLKEGDKCPTCKTSISSSHINMLKEEHDYELSQLVKAGKDKAAELLNHKNHIEALEKKFNTDKELKIKDLKLRYDELLKQINDIDKANLLNENTIKSKKDERVKIIRSEIEEIDVKINKIKDSYQEKDTSQKEEELRSEILVEKKLKAEVDAFNLEVKYSAKKNEENIIERDKILIENNTINEKISFHKSQVAICKQYTGIKVRLLSELIHSHLKNVTIELQQVVKSTGELKDSFNIMYNGVNFRGISRSEEVKTGLEISNLVRKVTNYNFPMFLDNAESITSYNVSKDIQLIEANVVKNLGLSIKEKYEDEINEEFELAQ